jgi:hypothetical protein
MSKLRIVAAAAAIAAAGSAHALTPAQIAAARAATTLKEIRIAGASALRLSVAAYMQEICDPTSFHVIWNSNAEGTNHRAYSCNLGGVGVGNYPAGTPVLVYKRDQGGSGQGVNPIATAADQTHMRVVNDATCTAINGGATPATDAAVPNYICTGTETTGIKSDAGISDVEPALLQASVNLATFNQALPNPTPNVVPLTSAQLATLNVGPLAQALFAVAVNKKAYRALQEAQGIIAPGGSILDVPADQSLWTAATLASIPSLPINFARSVFTGQAAGGASRGWDAVIPNVPYSLDGGVTFRPAVDANSNKKAVNICRRTEGSGTQAVSNAFFANNPCGAGVTAFTPSGVNFSVDTEASVSALVESPSFRVQEASGAGGVENCLGLDADTVVAAGTDNTAYAIGVLGREANPLRAGTDRLYRYVRLDGAIPVRSEAKAGRYPFVYEATMQWNTSTLAGQTDKLAFLNALRNGFGSPNGLAAVDSDTQQGVMSPPSAYLGTYAAATGNAALFGSRVGRIANNSCAPLRIVK